MKIYAPAKINLFLEVRNKRKDGYHNIETVMQAISLFDELEIRPRKKDITIKSNNPKIPPKEGNLVYKAAILLKDELGLDKGAEIFLKKKIPVGAGLGGGSSDAAATLIGLLRLWKKRIPQKKLIKIAEKIGSDVPFFLKGGLQAAKGKGEILKPLKTPKTTWFVIIYPGFGISTPWVYRNLHFPLTNMRKINRIKTLLSSGKSSSVWETEVFNRLEDTVFKKFKQISFIKKAISSYGFKSAMSGSGSTVFGIIKSRFQGEKLKKELSRKNWNIWVVKSVQNRRSDENHGS